MKPLAIWLAIFVVVFAAAGVGYHLARDSSPDRVFVVVDCSYEMEALRREVTRTLDEIDDERYAEFALATEKTAVHTWQSTLELGSVTCYGPRDLSGISLYPQVAEASELVLITNADPVETEGFDDWRIERIER
jgi:hypothetical protein